MKKDHPIYTSASGLKSILAGFVAITLMGSISKGQVASPVLTHQTFTIPSGTTYVGISILKPAILRGSISSIPSPEHLAIQTTFNVSTGLEPCPFMEITDCPSDPTLVGERFCIDSSSLRTPSQGGPHVLAVQRSAANTRSDLPSAFAGASFSIYPAWTLVDLFGGGKQPPLLKAGAFVASCDTVTLVHGTGSTKYWLKADKSKSPEWRATTGSSLTPVILPGDGFIVERRSGKPLRFSIAGERRQHLMRRPLRKGLNLISLPHPETSSISHLVLTAEQGWNSQDMLLVPDGQALRRFSWDVGNRKWQSLDICLDGSIEDLPLLAPDRSFVIEKNAPDPDFSLIPRSFVP